MTATPSRTAHGLDEILACAIAGCRLRSILLLDANPDELAAAVAALRDLARRIGGRTLRTLHLQSEGGEDELWLKLVLRQGENGIVAQQELGPLAVSGEDAAAPVIVVPDLARLGVPAARGLVAVLDAEVAHLERHGVSRTWRPDAWCVAACARGDVGRVSPHLLDRFLLRVDAHEVASHRDSVRRIRARLDGVGSDATARAAHGSSIHETPLPSVTKAALERLLHVAPSVGGAGHRRAITLARVATAAARLDGARRVSVQHVDRAARLLGLAVPAPRADSTIGPEPAPAAPARRPARRRPDVVSVLKPSEGDAATPPGGHEDVVHAAGYAVRVGAAELQDLPAGPYPEDASHPERELTPLKESGIRYRAQTVPRGRIVGVRRTATTSDLALLATILTAARWQSYRRRLLPEGPAGLRIAPTDLRSYRRAPDPEHLLIVLVDFTALPKWDWGELLVPHLRWAYVNRANVCLIRVGAADAHVETRAERLITRNLLDRRLDKALQAGAGRATPLAHGLVLALETLRHKAQHGFAAVRRARLVAITDGRGNVPLELGPDLRVSRPPGNVGVEEALAAARAFRTLATAEAVVVDPEPEVYGELVTQLAVALGAPVIRRDATGVTA